MRIHSRRKATGSTLELSVDGSQVEQVRSFKFLGVTINDTLTWSDHINMVCAKVFHNLNLLRRLCRFLPQPLLLSLTLTFSLSLTTVTLSGLGAPSPRLPGWRPSSTMPATLNIEGPPHRLLIDRELGLSTLVSRRKLHLPLIMFNCMSSKSPP